MEPADRRLEPLNDFAPRKQMPVQDRLTDSSVDSVLAGTEEVDRMGWQGSETDLSLSLKDQEGSPKDTWWGDGPWAPMWDDRHKARLGSPSPAPRVSPLQDRQETPGVDSRGMARVILGPESFPATSRMSSFALPTPRRFTGSLCCPCCAEEEKVQRFFSQPR